MSSRDHATSMTWKLCPRRVADSFQFSTLGPSELPKVACPVPARSS